MNQIQARNAFILSLCLLTFVVKDAATSTGFELFFNLFFLVYTTQSMIEFYAEMKSEESK